MHVFGGVPGQIQVVPDRGLPMRIVPDFWTGFPGLHSIMTSLGLRQQSNVQFLHTLRDYIYVYVFGERIGDLTIGGVTSTTPICDLPFHPVVGFERIYHYYNALKVSATGKPVHVTIGATIRLTAFLIGVDLTHQDPQTNLARFNLVFKYPPPARPGKALPALVSKIVIGDQTGQTPEDDSGAPSGGASSIDDVDDTPFDDDWWDDFPQVEPKPEPPGDDEPLPVAIITPSPRPPTNPDPTQPTRPVLIPPLLPVEGPSPGLIAPFGAASVSVTAPTVAADGIGNDRYPSPLTPLLTL